MYYIQNKTTGQPIYLTNKGKVEKTYSLRLIAEIEAEKLDQDNHLKATRIDVVEISKSARLYMENQARLKEKSPNTV
jgi:hypothetical protein